MTIKTKIMLRGFLAIDSLSCILALRIVTEIHEHDENLVLLVRLDTATRLPARVHDLQRERGVSAGYLVDARQRMAENQMAAVDSFGYYTQTIVEILDRIDALARESNTTMLKQELRTHVHLLYAMEYLGQIRTGINESLAQGGTRSGFHVMAAAWR